MKPACVLLLLGVASCSTSDPDLGNSVLRNNVAQVVDMNPQYAGVPMEASNGKRSVAAQERYVNGNVKQLLKVSGNTEVGTQGGATDSGGGGAPQ